ncbi:hypothetical protein AGOR_G00042730 [Albula goreensis]|uniref:Acyl-CoA-binding domain-containing protein 5 n=1 Tax=Albula goreensis TaxID=1534307 RepID=A0A8T3E1X2_9TELE|nr:hypothetical protein AGOR_G00042730 [Albula goreensis]
MQNFLSFGIFLISLNFMSLFVSCDLGSYDKTGLLGEEICSRHSPLCVTMADDKPIYEIRFDAAVRVIQSLPRNGPFQPSNDMMLKFYSYYKQATLGPCNIPRPGFWDPVGKVKWDVWNSLGDMPREKAMMAYVDELKLILETIPVTEQVVDLLDVLGPFYEVADDTKGASQTNEEEVSITRLKVEDSSGKAQVLLSNGSVEHSISSMTNGTHSSLNSECTEEELACTLQPPEQTCDINGHLSDHGEEEVTGPLQLASDSDSEVYCDSMEQFGLEEGCGVQINHSLETGEVSHPCRVEQGLLGEAPGRDDPLGGVNGIQHGGEEGTPGNHTPQGERLTAGRHDTSLVRKGRGSRSSGSGSGSGSGAGARGGLLGGGGDGERWGSEGGAEGTLNEQIAMALARLQEDMKSVLQRLQTLEALTTSQTRSLSLPQNYPSASINKKLSWWPFDVSPGTVAFAVVWPFVVHWLVRLYLQRRRRKMN